jgi:hypothetical protein
VTHHDTFPCIEELGFTPPQARFLALAAMNSGYCLRRQYMNWAGIPRGRTNQEFFELLEQRRVATSFVVCPQRGRVYHLKWCPLYNLLGQRNNGNRREHPLPIVEQRVTALDFVLAQRDCEFFPTQQDKLRLFQDEYGVPRDRLPTRLYRFRRVDRPPNERYFIEKPPIFRQLGSRVVDVGYVWTARTAWRFGSFLRQYAPFLLGLPQPRGSIVLIVPRHYQWTDVQAAQTFAKLVRAHLIEYFHLRAAPERRVPIPAKDAVRRLDRDRDRYASETYEALYHRWRTEGDTTLSLDHPCASDWLPSFRVHRTPYTYEQFGYRRKPRR